MAPSSDTRKALPFHVFAHPLHPFDQDQTRLAFDLADPGDVPDTLRSSHLQLRNGGAITFEPSTAHSPSAAPGGPPDKFDQLAAGFAFVRAPGSNSTDTIAALAPVGAYRADPATGDTTFLMPALSGQEYIRSAAPLTLVLRTGQPAAATGFTDATPAEPGHLLSAEWVTSGCQVLTGPSMPVDGYYAQPDASTFYADGDDGQHIAVAAQISRLPPSTMFPIAPLLGLFPDGDGPNPYVPAETLQRFVEKVVTPARYQAIVDADRSTDDSAHLHSEGEPRLPRFLTTGSSTAAAGSAMSPQGLLVGLDGNGNWTEVTLARSPVNPDQLLRFFTGGQPLDPNLVEVLLKSQLVWVVTRLDLLDGFNSVLSVGEFDFCPGQVNSDAPQPVLIFKFSTATTLTDVIESTASWTDPDQWIGTPTDHLDPISHAQESLRQALAEANATIGKPIDPYAHFRATVANDPSWTGIISINTAIDPSSMPPDLQMLYAGISKPLTAHHFGIESSQLSGSTERTPQIVKSSLFGVIHYVGGPETPDALRDEQPGMTPYGFAVRDLTVVLANSAVVDFHAEIALRVEALFGRAVTMTAPAPAPGEPANTIRLAGTYQRSGAVGTVTFQTRTPFTFTIDAGEGLPTRVLQSVSVHSASLIPVASDSDPKSPAAPDGVTNPDGKQIRAHFSMAGTMAFAAQPFPADVGSDPLDVFGYGTADGGLDFTDLRLDIGFTLSPEGKRIGDPTISFDATGLVPTAQPSAIRDGALAKGLPLMLTAFKAAAPSESGQPSTGINTSDLSAQSVNLPQAMSSSITSAHYALVYELPLGSLGSLAEVGASISASLVIGWGPSPAVPDNDGFCVMVQLPQATAGVAGFSLQGILKVVFGEANLMRVPYPDPASGTGVWVVVFNNVQLSLLSIRFPPGVIANFVLFADPNEPTTSNVAWYLAVAQKGGKDKPDLTNALPRFEPALLTAPVSEIAP